MCTGIREPTEDDETSYTGKQFPALGLKGQMKEQDKGCHTHAQGGPSESHNQGPGASGRRCELRLGGKGAQDSGKKFRISFCKDTDQGSLPNRDANLKYMTLG